MRSAVLFVSLALMPASAFAEKTRVMFVGSSSIEHWKPRIEKDFGFAAVRNFGLGGTKYTYVIQEAEGWTKANPDVEQIVVYSGDNDVNEGGTPAEVSANFAEAMKRLHKGLPDAEIHVLSIKPSPEREANTPMIDRINDQIEKQSKRLGYVNYVEVHIPMLDEEGKSDEELYVSDRIHLDKDGYDLWTKLLAPVLAKCGDSGAATFSAGVEEMYTLHKTIPSLKSIPEQARAFVERIDREILKACKSQLAIANQVQASVKDLPAGDGQAGYFAETIKMISKARRDIDEQRSKLHEKYNQLAGEVRGFGAKGIKVAEAASAGEKSKERKAQLLKEAKGSRRLAATAARELLSVDHDLSLLSEKLAENASLQMAKWEKLSVPGEEIESARKEIASNNARHASHEKRRFWLLRL